jgi:hypothetical protein
LTAQFSEADGKIPAAHPPQLLAIEFTDKFEPLAILATPLPIEVNRLINMPA